MENKWLVTITWWYFRVFPFFPYIDCAFSIWKAIAHILLMNIHWMPSSLIIPKHFRATCSHLFTWIFFCKSDLLHLERCKRRSSVCTTITNDTICFHRAYLSACVAWSKYRANIHEYSRYSHSVNLRNIICDKFEGKHCSSHRKPTKCKSQRQHSSPTRPDCQCSVCRWSELSKLTTHA